MHAITEQTVDAAIKRIGNLIPSYSIDPEFLGAFTQRSEDQEFLSYVQGTGGAYCKFLSLLIRELDIVRVLELGNREGLSTLAIYSGLPVSGYFTSVDIAKDLRYCPPQMFTDSRVRLLYGDVSDLGIYQDDYPFDTELLFTDTIHFDFQLRNEYAIYQHFLADTALVAIDDINVNDKRRLFDELPFPKWDLTDLCHASGWGLVLYQRQPPATKEVRLLSAYKASAGVWQRAAVELRRREANSVTERFKRMTVQLLRRYRVVHRLSLFLRGK